MERVAEASSEFRRLITPAIAMFGLLLASYAINAMDRQIFPLLLTDVRKEYGFSLADGGLLSTIFTLGMAAAGVPTGFLLARASRKTVLISGIAIFSIGTGITAASRGFADMLVYRASTGIGEAMQLTVLIAIAANYFEHYRAAAVGSVNFAFGIGAILGPYLGGHLLTAYQTWRVPMLVFAALGFVAILLIAIFVSRNLTEVRGVLERHEVGGGAPRMMNRNTLLLTALSVLAGLVIYGYLGLYPTYLREVLKYSPEAAGSVMGIYGLGVLASIVGGWFGDRFSPRVVLGTAFLIAGLLGYLLFHGIDRFVFQAALSFVWGFVISGTIYVNIAGYHVKAVRTALSGKASGLFVTSLYASAACAGYIMGYLASTWGWATAANIQIIGISIAGGLISLALHPADLMLAPRQALDR
jgi:MFS transporter, DHA1 family, inner membrane transport protein